MHLSTGQVRNFVISTLHAWFMFNSELWVYMYISMSYWCVHLREQWLHYWNLYMLQLWKQDNQIYLLQVSFLSTFYVGSLIFKYPAILTTVYGSSAFIQATCATCMVGSYAHKSKNTLTLVHLLVYAFHTWKS